AIAVLAQVLELAPALAQGGDHGSGELFAAIDHELLVRLLERAVGVPLEDHLRPAERELVRLAAHRLGEDRERELATAENEEGIGVGGALHAKSHVPLQLLL